MNAGSIISSPVKGEVGWGMGKESPFLEACSIQFCPIPTPARPLKGREWCALCDRFATRPEHA